MTHDLTADDFLHTPDPTDRWWSETYWFSFDDPANNLSCHFYPMVRANLDIASLAVMVWGPGQESPWTATYFRSQWHLEAPQFDSNRLSLDHLSYEIIEPMQQYRVRYDDPGLFTADLLFTACAEPFAAGGHAASYGHIDQPMKVQGQIELHGKVIVLDCHGMRDRSWGPRSDMQDGSRALYFYGISDAESFLIMKLLDRDPPITIGYLDRDGKRGLIREAIVRREDGPLSRIELVSVTAQDEHGRLLEVTGAAKSHFAMQANPHQFAWISMVDWNDGAMLGQFQEVLGRGGLNRLAREAFTKLRS